jgi:SAM-dependent methyltransferase
MSLRFLSKIAGVRAARTRVSAIRLDINHMNLMITLDVGCGSEAYGPTVTARGSVCIDIGRPFRKPGMFIQADAHHLPFRNNVFDKAFFYDVIEHVDSPIRCLKEIARVLKPGGDIEISTPNPLHWRKFLRALRGKDILLTPVPDHISTWTDAEMRNILIRSGFSSISFKFTILKASEIANPSHMKYDKPLHKLIGKVSRVTGQNMIINAKKR